MVCVSWLSIIGEALSRSRHGLDRALMHVTASFDTLNKDLMCHLKLLNIILVAQCEEPRHKNIKILM